MKRVLVAALLLFASPCSHADAVRVRFFSQHPPVEIRITPRGAIEIRNCQTCVPSKQSAPLHITLAGDRLRVTSELAGQSRSRSQTAILITGAYQLEATGAPALQLDMPIEARIVHRSLLITVAMPLEQYVAAVLAGEAGGFRSDESLKAMAVAARTFAVRFRGRHQAEGFDFCDSTHCQDVHLSAVTDRLRNAAAATEGEMLWYEGRPAATYYHRSCGGGAEAGRFLDAQLNAPYLRQHSDPYCLRAGRADWRADISKDELRVALASQGVHLPASFTIAVRSRTPSGRAQSIALGNSPELLLGAERFRMLVGRALGWDRIRSDLYEVSDGGSSLIFLGHGEGHGVGLCQAGAEQMGELGKSYREILNFYYPGTTLGLTASGLVWQHRSGERVDLLSGDIRRDEALIAMAERNLRDAEHVTGWRLTQRPQIKVYPSVAVFRDATSEPGWIAASTRGQIIRMQPSDVLARGDRVESVLRHELFHMLIEAHARRDLPLWFREGIVLALSGATPTAARAQPPSTAWLEHTLQNPSDRSSMQRAYAGSQWRVQHLINDRGLPTVLGWVEHGLPRDALLDVGLGPAAASRR